MSRKTIFAASVPLKKHAEEILLEKLTQGKIDPSSVTEVYSELEPCIVPSANCTKLIKSNFPQADVTWSIKSGSTKPERRRAMRDLKRAIENADQYQLRFH